jgi:2-polyprenyl-3-methyl-5-hydroxy-6-metoxy-1,4-benzoquinol methylase
VGCGQGWAEVLLAATFSHVAFDCVDTQPHFRKVEQLAKQLALTNISFTLGDIFRMHDGDYDLSFSVEVVEHIEDAKAAARHLMATLRPGGYLFTLVPFASPSEQRDPVAKQCNWENYQHHVVGYDEQTLRELFPGHAVVWCHGVYWQDCATPLRNIMQALPNELLEANSEHFYTLARHDFRPRVPTTRREALGIKILTQDQSAVELASPVMSAPITDVPITRQEDFPVTTITQGKSAVIAVSPEMPVPLTGGVSTIRQEDSPMPVLMPSESSVKTVTPAMPASIARRRKMLFRHVSATTQTGLELGPLDAPVISTTEASIKYADFVTYEELLRRHSARRDASRIVRPDYLITPGSLAVQITDRFDYVIACHVIEHIPNMIAWLNDLHSLLTANGRLFLAVPDKRYTFDILRPETSLAHIMNDFYRAVTVPDLEHILEHLFLKREVSATAAWKGDIQLLLEQQRYTLDQAYTIARQKFETEGCVDVHCHVFTGAAFLTAIQQLIAAKFIHYQVVDFVEVEKPYNEFLCTLAKV